MLQNNNMKEYTVYYSGERKGVCVCVCVIGDFSVWLFLSYQSAGFTTNKGKCDRSPHLSQKAHSAVFKGLSLSLCAVNCWRKCTALCSLLLSILRSAVSITNHHSCLKISEILKSVLARWRPLLKYNHHTCGSTYSLACWTEAKWTFKIKRCFQ